MNNVCIVCNEVSHMYYVGMAYQYYISVMCNRSEVKCSKQVWYVSIVQILCHES